MRTPCALAALTLCIFAPAPGPAFPQDAPPAPAPAAPIRVAPPTKAPVRLRMEVTEELTWRRGTHLRARTTLDAAIRTRGPADGGGLQIEVSFLRVSGYDASARPRPDADWDAAALTDHNRGAADVVQSASLAGSTLLVAVEPSGRLRDLQGAGAILRRALEIAGDDEVRDVLSAHLTASSLRTVVEGLLGFGPFPEDGAAEWIAPRDGDGSWRMRRGGTRPGFATLTGTLEIQDPPPPGLDLVPVSGSRTAEVSLADGLPLSARTEIEHRERVTMQEPGSSRTEEAWMTVRTVRTCARLADLPPLRVTSPPGKPLPATLVITGEQDLEVGGKGLVKHEFEFSYEFEMKGLGATPGPRVEIRFRRVHGRLNSKVLPLGEFDSAKPLPTDPNLRKAHASLTAWAGTTVRLALDAAGAIQDVEGLEAAREAAVRRLRLTPDEASELRLTMDGRRIRELFEYAFHGVPYPKDANERWTTHAVLPGTAEGMKVRIAWTHERTGTDAADPAAIASAGTVRLETDAALPLQFDTKSSTAKGSSSVSPLDGLPLAATTDVRFHGEASAGTAKVSVRQTVISRFERQADPPPARK